MTSPFTPKKLGNKFAEVYIEKKIDFQSIDIDSEFTTKKNAQKLFVEVCMKSRDGEVVEIDYEENDVDCSNKWKKVKK